MSRRIAGLIVLLGAAAAPAEGAGGPRYGGELRVAAPARDLASDGASTGSAERLLAGLTNESLLRAARDGALQPNLVKTWTAGPGENEWTLTLEEGLRFHDGLPLAASSAVRSIARFVRGPSAAGAVLAERLDGGASYRSRTRDDLPGAQATDDLHVRLRFASRSSALDLLPLAAPDAAVTSERGSGCGPFVPTVTSGPERLLVAFGGHVRGRPYLDRVRVTRATDDRREVADFKAGRTPLLLSPVAPASGRAVSGARLLILVLDPRSAAFSSRERRLRISRAVDRESLAARLLPGAIPWRRLLLSDDRPVETDAGAVTTSATGASARVLTMVVDRSVPPLISQRIVAHLAAVGLPARVTAASPADADRLPADVRLLFFEPAVPEAALTLHEIAGLQPAAEENASAPALEADPGRRAEQAAALEARLLDSATFIPLARVGAAAIAGPRLQDAGDGGPWRLEDAWLTP